MVDFFCCEKSHPILKGKDVFEMKIVKEELRFEESLKKRIKFICEFSKVTPISVGVKPVKFIENDTE